MWVEKEGSFPLRPCDSQIPSLHPEVHLPVFLYQLQRALLGGTRQLELARVKDAPASRAGTLL